MPSKPTSTQVQQLADTATETVDWPARKLHRVRRSRWLSGFGGLLLVCSFFLPAVPVCDHRVIPAEEWLRHCRGTSDWSLVDPEALAWMFLFYGAAYLFGLLVLIATFRSRGYRRRVERSLGTSVSRLLGIVAGLIASLMIWGAACGSWPTDWQDWAFVAVALGGLAYWLRSRRLGPSGLICARWFTALCGLLWFGLWVAHGDALYGMWLSFSGCLCILAGTSAEAAARNPEGGWATLWDLLRCKYRLHDLEGNRCAECDYLLIGLTSSRCPECGQPFEYAAVHDGAIRGAKPDLGGAGVHKDV